MKTFISWSGDLSKSIADSLCGWLPKVIQAIQPFYSPDDIGIGNRWFSEVETHLSDSDFGILCLTGENSSSPWIMFEAGALSKNIGQSRVMPLLFGINYADISGPLSQFQAVKFNKEDFFRFVQSVNDMLAGSSLSQLVLLETFEKWWPDLEKKVNQILSGPRNIKELKARSVEDILEEVLGRVRHLNNEIQLRKITVHPDAAKELISYYIDFCNSMSKDMGNSVTIVPPAYIFASIGRISFIEPALLHLLYQAELPADEFISLKNDFEEAKGKIRIIFQDIQKNN
jgi:hypothetical protein